MINNYPLNSWGIVVEYLLLFPVDRDTHEFFLPSSERSNVFDAAKDKSVSDHIFEPNGSSVYYPQNVSRNKRAVLKTGRYI